MNWLKKHSGLFIVLLLSLWTIRPLFVAGFFPMHDDTQVARVFEMGKALGDGMFPVRWVPDLGYGYGYPLFNFYGPLSYYVGGFFVLLHTDALLATKLMIGIGMLLAGGCMYFLGKKVFGEMGGITAALFYMYAPYHAVDLYVRGAIGELWAYAFIPLVFYGLYMVCEKKKWKYVGVGSFAYASIILSHNLTAFMLTPFLGIFIVLLCIASYHKEKNLITTYYLLLTTFLGLLLSAFYSLPAIFEMQYTNVSSQIGGGADFNNHFVCIQQLWNSPWGFGGSASGCSDGLSFMIGKLHLIFIALVLIGMFLLWKKDRLKAIAMSISMFLFLFSCFIMLEISKPLWVIVPQAAFIQYPWRFLTFACFFASISAGGVIYTFQKVQKRNVVVVSIFVIALVFYSYSKFFVSQTITAKTAADYTGFKSLRWDASKISDEYMPKNFIKVTDSHDTVNGKFAVAPKDGVIDSEKQKTQDIQATIFVQKTYSPVEILLAHFPAWHIFVDGKSTIYQETHRGYTVKVGQGRHIVEAKFEQTAVEKTGNVLSIIGFGIVVVGIIYATRKGISAS